jgi:hypothetical protein
MSMVILECSSSSSISNSDELDSAASVRLSIISRGVSFLFWNLKSSMSWYKVEDETGEKLHLNQAHTAFIT